MSSSSQTTTYNPSHDISELFNVLRGVRFHTSKTKVDI